MQAQIEETNHMILRLIEEWKEKLGKEFWAGTVLMDSQFSLTA